MVSMLLISGMTMTNLVGVELKGEVKSNSGSLSSSPRTRARALFVTISIW